MEDKARKEWLEVGIKGSIPNSFMLMKESIGYKRYKPTCPSQMPIIRNSSIERQQDIPSITDNHVYPIRMLIIPRVSNVVTIDSAL